MVDDQFDKAPPIERDAFWEDVMAEPLYTAEAASRPCNPQIGSCSNIPLVFRVSRNVFRAHLDDLVMLRCRRTSLVQKHLNIGSSGPMNCKNLQFR